MLISTSLRQKLIATLVVALGLVFFYETTAIDSRYSAPLFRPDAEGGIVKASAEAPVERRDPARRRISRPPGIPWPQARRRCTARGAAKWPG
jgi:hypothetical protein